MDQEQHHSVKHTKLALFAITAFLVVMSIAIISISNQLANNNEADFNTSAYGEENEPQLSRKVKPGKTFLLECLGKKFTTILSNDDKSLLVSCLNDESSAPQEPTPLLTLAPTDKPTTIHPTDNPSHGNPPTTQITLPPVAGDFPCGKFPNANPGCRAVSFQSWFDDVPASNETMSVNYTPKLCHWHYEYNVPIARANGQNLKQGMKIPVQFVRYNCPVTVDWVRTQNKGNTFEQYNVNLAKCQNSKYEGEECRSEHIHTVRDSDMKSNTEIRSTPNSKNFEMGGGRHFLSSNWQTGIGYRNSSELTTRYWQAKCGSYQRTIVRNADKYFVSSEPIPTVKGTITLPFETNGGCGDRFKTFVFLDPKQHVTTPGTQTGTTLMEQEGHFKGDLTWDTTATTNGIHSVLFINMEGKSDYVAASGVNLLFNVQN